MSCRTFVSQIVELFEIRSRSRGLASKIRTWTTKNYGEPNRGKRKKNDAGGDNRRLGDYATWRFETFCLVLIIILTDLSFETTVGVTKLFARQQPITLAFINTLLFLTLTIDNKRKRRRRSPVVASFHGDG